MDEFETTCEMEEEEELASSPLPSRRRSSSLRAALKERANKIVQTTARHSWSLMRQLQGTHRARGDNDDDDARGEDERKRPGRERRTRDGETRNDQFNSVPRKLIAILSLGQTKNFDFVDFVDCISAGIEGIRGGFWHADFRLHGNNDNEFSGFIVHVVL